MERNRSIVALILAKKKPWLTSQGFFFAIVSQLELIAGQRRSLYRF
jgi:hypothetical protein